MVDPSPLSPADQPPGVVVALRVIRERWWVIALAAVVCTAAALALSLSSTKQYEATAKLLFAVNTLPAQVGGSSVAPDNDPEATKATRTLLVTTGDVADRVRKRLNLKISSDDAQRLVTAAPESNANIIDVIATDPDPATAARVANTWVQEFVAFSQSSARGEVQEGERLIRQRIDELPPAAADDDRKSLNDALSRLVLLEAVQTGDAQIVGRASVPDAPSSPKPKRDAAIALVVGALLGLGLAFLLNVLDRRVKSIEDFERLYGFPALTSIPLQSREPSSHGERQAALEPFRILRNALSLLGDGSDPRVILVTSALPGEGKSTVAAGLSRALALSGHSVALVEVDLRRPTFHLQFALRDDPRGLTSALVGGAPVRDLLRPVLPGLKTLTVLPSGPLPPNPAELLRSPQMGDVLADLTKEVDFVVLDAPPMLPIADCHALLDQPEVDACLVVARSHKTKRDEIERNRGLLQRHRVSHFGLVINGVRAPGDSYGGYETTDGELLHTPAGDRR